MTDATIMVRIILILILLFFSSMLSVIVGYYNTLLGFDIRAVECVFESVPIIKTSIVLALACPAYLLLSFFASKGNYESYKSGLIGYCMVVSIVIVLVMLPGELSKPDHLQLNCKSMFFVVFASQCAATILLQKAFWVLGGRELHT